MPKEAKSLVPDVKAKKKSDFPDFYPKSQKKVEIGKTELIPRPVKKK